MLKNKVIKTVWVFDDQYKIPRVISHPGISLYNYIRCADMSYKEFARLANMPTRAVRRLCRGKLNITPDIADRLADVIGGAPRHWIEAQEAWDEV